VSGTAADGAGGAGPADPRLVLLLALADDELVIGHRHSHWTGVAPHLEEDLAFSSIAQDEISHAVIWYRLAAEHTGPDGVRALARHSSGGDPVDALGLGRPPQAYRNAVLVERDNGDWGYSLARQYLYDTADAVRLAALADSSWVAVAQATAALQREERYHLLHARTWLERLAHGPIAGRQRLAAGLTAALDDALGLFEPLPGEEHLVAEGVLPVPTSTLLERWLDVVATELEAAGLERVLGAEAGAADGELVPTASGELYAGAARAEEAATAPAGAAALAVPRLERRDGAWAPVGGFAGAGGRRGRHSAAFTAVWEELTGTYRAHPGARW
jgi:ring-1,2-phenylacetyl-CoA epoxidase subunit PaaC